MLDPSVPCLIIVSLTATPHLESTGSLRWGKAKQRSQCSRPALELTVIISDANACAQTACFDSTESEFQAEWSAKIA